MSVTTNPDTATLHGASLIDAAFAAAAVPDTADPVTPAAETAAPVEDGAAPAEETPEQSASPETPAPEQAPERVYTEAELKTQIEDATKRARADQSRMARELRDAKAAAHARQEALNKLQSDAETRYIDRPAILEEQFRLQNYERQLISQDDAASEQAAQAQGQLLMAKEQAARTDYLTVMADLMSEAAPLGFDRAKVDILLSEIADTDELARSYVVEFDQTADYQTALTASQRLYQVLAREAKVRLAAAKMAEISSAAPPKPRIERPQVHGSAGSVGNDPYRDVTNWGERGRRRLDDAFAAWAATEKE